MFWHWLAVATIGDVTTIDFKAAVVDPASYHAAVDAFRQAIEAAPAEAAPKMQLAELLLGHVTGWGHAPSDALDATCAEIGSLMRQVLDSPASMGSSSSAGRLRHSAALFHARALRVHTKSRDKAAAFLQAELARDGLTQKRRIELMIEQAHQYLQHYDLAEALKLYQAAYDAAPQHAPAFASVRHAAKQGGAMVLAMQARCMMPAHTGSVEACQEALAIFLEVPDEHTEPTSWMMRGYILR